MADDVLLDHQHRIPTVVWTVFRYVWKTHLFLYLHHSIYGRMFRMLDQPDHVAAQRNEGTDGIWRRGVDYYG